MSFSPSTWPGKAEQEPTKSSSLEIYLRDMHGLMVNVAAKRQCGDCDSWIDNPHAWGDSVGNILWLSSDVAKLKALLLLNGSEDNKTCT